ncbi:hypothetical protein GQX74_012647 [Glossina fuscipes]|nr:hypothetical protein GQX74_012647 [Glossina fuscipes]
MILKSSRFTFRRFSLVLSMTRLVKSLRFTLAKSLAASLPISRAMYKRGKAWYGVERLSLLRRSEHLMPTVVLASVIQNMQALPY